MSVSTRRPLALTGALALTLVLAACGGSDTDAADSGTSGTSTPSESGTATESDDHEGEGEEGHDEEAGATEAAARTPRVTLTYDGGLLVLDASTLEVEADLPLDGFNRLSDAGDGRHVAVTTAGGWALLDAGTWSQAHGDHSHYFTAAPALHDVIVEAETPAHVVVHDGLTALFDDGTGDVTVVPADGWADAAEAGEVAPVRTFTTPSAHHGVAVASQDGQLVVTEGTDEGRTGARVLDASDVELDASAECPGVHGETVAGEETVVLGCEDGVLILHGDHFHKVASPDAYGRIGNQFGTETSSVVLGDYKTDPEGVLTSVSLIDTEAETIQIVDIGSQYTFRNLARGDDDTALVLGTDGALRVIDPTTGEIVRTAPVIDAWEVPEEWQQPQPAVKVVDGMAYITEPATNELHVVDYETGEVWKSTELPATPNEMVVVTG
ncbi:hypothetical protein [Litorihabitans aurantiacus]|uniref:Secreted protein n=1 Tax=Litorihabitans aurantiacus TaxID=1930061 RepID=A0AA37XI11_9MICO|nr:hypothetical protein [Litorihabitans aurantiacus]GMA33337.1 hypothetical protein GCM10025875_33290 [Litorihabitans aurantiacus]